MSSLARPTPLYSLLVSPHLNFAPSPDARILQLTATSKPTASPDLECRMLRLDGCDRSGH